MREPVVYLTIDPKEPSDVTYDVSFRLNRPLPRESVHIKATLTIGGASPSGEILRYGRRARACYAATINFKAPEIPEPRFKLIVNARLKIDGVKSTLLAHVRLRNYAIDQASDFHCGKGGLDRQE